MIQELIEEGFEAIGYMKVFFQEHPTYLIISVGLMLFMGYMLIASGERRRRPQRPQQYQQQYQQPQEIVIRHVFENR